MNEGEIKTKIVGITGRTYLLYLAILNVIIATTCPQQTNHTKDKLRPTNYMLDLKHWVKLPYLIDGMIRSQIGVWSKWIILWVPVWIKSHPQLVLLPGLIQIISKVFLDNTTWQGLYDFHLIQQSRTPFGKKKEKKSMARPISSIHLKSNHFVTIKRAILTKYMVFSRP